MLIPFNTTAQGDFWRYQIKAVPLHPSFREATHPGFSGWQE